MNVIGATNALLDLQKMLKKPQHEDDSWRKKFLDVFEKFKTECGIVDLDHANMGPLDYVASMIYSFENHGVDKPWSTLVDSIREQYRGKAINTIASWASDQMKFVTGGKLT